MCGAETDFRTPRFTMVMMRTLRLLLVAIMAVSLSPAFAQDEETIDWLDNYDKALAEAKRTNKPIFLEFRCEA
jgi:hypothetical protein